MISVIIPCKGHAAELAGCLSSIARNALPQAGFEVIVVNVGADQAVNALVAHHPFAREIQTTEAAPGEARNLGAAKAAGEALAFTDADCRPTPGWLRGIETWLASGAIMVGGAVEDEASGNGLARADNVLHFYQYSVQRAGGSAHFLTGANMAVLKTAFNEAGGFPALKTSEDMYLSKKIALRHPERSIFDPNLIVHHAGRRTWHTVYQHQYPFGYDRAVRQHEITAFQQHMGRLRLAIPLVIFKRLLNIYTYTSSLGPAALLKRLFLLPFVTAALIPWAIGFRDGCRDAAAGGILD